MLDFHSHSFCSKQSISIAFIYLKEHSLSEDIGAVEASDILSAISNEECSVTSEILDKNSSANSQSTSHINAIEVIQVIFTANAANYYYRWNPCSTISGGEQRTKTNDKTNSGVQNLESDRLGHIDSPEDDESPISTDGTEPFHGESLLDDISSVLGHDFLGALQDSTITEDTTTLCGIEKPKRKLSSKRKSIPIVSTNVTNQPLLEGDDSLENSNENPLQFGFENIVFEIDNRCDDQKAGGPSRCSLAHFIEGNDIARQSSKVSTFTNIHISYFESSLHIHQDMSNIVYYSPQCELSLATSADMKVKPVKIIHHCTLYQKESRTFRCSSRNFFCSVESFKFVFNF